MIQYLGCGCECVGGVRDILDLSNVSFLHLPKDQNALLYPASFPSSRGGHALYGTCHTCEGMLGNGGQGRRQRLVLVLTRLAHRRLEVWNDTFSRFFVCWAAVFISTLRRRASNTRAQRFRPASLHHRAAFSPPPPAPRSPPPAHLMQRKSLFCRHCCGAAVGCCAGSAAPSEHHARL